MIRSISRLTVLLLVLYLALPAGQMISGSVSCPSSGNVVLSSTSSSFTSGTLQSAFGNSGRIYVGGSSVSTTTGVYLSAAGSTLSLPPAGNSASYNLAGIYIACTSSGDTLTYTVVK